MASVTMTASFLSSSAITSGSGRGMMSVKASRGSEGEKPNMIVEKNNNGKDASGSNGRRELVFAAAAAAIYSITNGGAMAGEPKRGSAEAKKKYGPICVTMPTASICHN